MIFFAYGNDPINTLWLYILLSTIVLDMIFAILNAIIDGTFKRKILLIGLRTKLGEMVLIAIAHWLDMMNITQNSINLQKTVTGALVFYELLSLLAKIKVGGTPIPKILINTIQNWKDGKSNG